MKKNSSNSHKKAHKTQVFIFLSFLYLLCPFVVPAQSPDVLQAFEQVAALIRDDRLAEAEQELKKVLRLQPDLPVALNLMGSLRAKQGRLAEAESLFLRAVEGDKNFT